MWNLFFSCSLKPPGTSNNLPRFFRRSPPRDHLAGTRHSFGVISLRVGDLFQLWFIASNYLRPCVEQYFNGNLRPVEKGKLLVNLQSRSWKAKSRLGPYLASAVLIDLRTQGFALFCTSRSERQVRRRMRKISVRYSLIWKFYWCLVKVNLLVFILMTSDSEGMRIIMTAVSLSVMTGEDQ